jgi:hypothetical protein
LAPPSRFHRSGRPAYVAMGARPRETSPLASAAWFELEPVLQGSVGALIDVIFNLLERHRDKWREDGECYRWIAATTGVPGLRPVVRIGGRKGKNYYVSRLVCEEINGPPPTSKHEAAHDTLNGCIGGLCVNGEHLRWATGKENSRDEPREARSRRSRKGMGMVYDLPYHVTFDQANQKYKVHIDGKSIGRYLTVDEAVAARDKYLKVKGG